MRNTYSISRHGRVAHRRDALVRQGPSSVDASSAKLARALTVYEVMKLVIRYLSLEE